MATNRFGLALAAGVLALCVGNVGISHAATAKYKFYQGGNGYAPYNPGGGNSIDLPLDAYNQTKGEPDACAGGGFNSCSETIGPSLTFEGLVNITATANGSNDVWHDYSPNFGGLGVDEGGGSASDHINGSDILKLSFAGGNDVQLTGVATLMAGGHKPFNEPNFDETTWEFGIRVDETGDFQRVSFIDANAVDLGDLALIGTVFEFMQLDSMPSFYVSALIVDTEPGQNTPVPLPGALPLLLSGLGLLWYGRRRRAS